MAKKVALITGGTGFLGHKLVGELLKKNYMVRVVARNEGKLILLKNEYPEIEIFPGDICNKITAYQCCKDVNAIYHLAAFKHVRLAEKFALECINTNVIGTINILNETLNNPNLEYVIGISTDKVAKVTGTYGASKYLMESLFYQYESLNARVKYRLVRYGNVLYSTGSVLCIWKERLLKGEEIIITDKNVTRFYWSLEEAIKLIFDCLKYSTSTKPYLPEMKTMSLGDILEAMKMKYLPKDKELKVKVIGLQKGENLHERLIMNGPLSSEYEKYTIDEIYKMI
jgi:UDP-N-acetylglucosamine 4,6-dehydratase/UDP-glucose 4-epimerase|tara:strand:+ start:5576 stop:6427 length:852 start_codon:yes stop_codon:yes gene_type:complete